MLSKFVICPQGCHDFSRELYQSLRTRVASEHFYFWLNSLMEFSQAEQCLSGLSDGDYSAAMSAISEALKSYQKGIASLTVRIHESCSFCILSITSCFCRFLCCCVHTEAQKTFSVTDCNPVSSSGRQYAAESFDVPV